jgi:hypothetical protein
MNTIEPEKKPAKFASSSRTKGLSERLSEAKIIQANRRKIAVAGILDDFLSTGVTIDNRGNSNDDSAGGL